jgi:type VI secretion system protein ImpF
MASRYEPDNVVSQPLLDRLIDHEPKHQSEAALTHSQSVRGLKNALRRDLEWLLNTRQNPDQAGEEYAELSHSLYNYGFPDFSSFSFSNPKDRQRLLKSLEGTIRVFEPRLEGVRVIPVETPADDLRRIVRFQIEGLLLMDPSPEQITFDTVLSLTNGEYQIRGDRG